jgi:Protein phosphatase 2C
VLSVPHQTTHSSRNGAATRWRVHGVSVPGYGHLRDGVECQDAGRQAFVDAAGAHVLAVADGAGSRARSAEGAALAVGLAVEFLGERLAAHGVPAGPGAWRELLAAAYQDLVAAFADATSRMGPDPAAFAATLTAVVLAYPWLGVVSIGDGFVITRAEGEDERDSLHLVTCAGPAGEYVNEAVFLSSAAALSDVTVDCLYDPGLTGVVLGTDGLLPAAIRRAGGRPRPNRSFLEPLLGSLEVERPDPTGVARLLLDDRISALSADDKTLLMAVSA